MIPTRWLLAILGGLFSVGIVPIAVNLVSQKLIDRQFELMDAAYFYFAKSLTFEVWEIFLLAVVIAGLVVLFNLVIERRDRQFNLEIERRDREVEELTGELKKRDDQITDITKLLHDARQIHFLDIVTGIPNEAKWEDDISDFAEKVSAKTPRQVALIDLVDFGRWNRELGYSKVDQMLRFLAQSLDESMRKNEGLYRRPLEDKGMLPKETTSRDRIYRKYPGGDEFYVVAEGSEASMLGLLTRLQRLITTRLNEEIKANIANQEVKIRFAGGVCQLYRGERPDRLKQRLVDCLRPTGDANAELRLNWESGKRSVDFKPGTIERTLYDQAEKEFRRDPDGSHTGGRQEQ